MADQEWCEVAVVGGGVSGLSAAWHLRRQLDDSKKIVVIEQADRPGGTAWTESADGYCVETGPNGFLDNKPSTLDLCRRLGLEGRLIRADEQSANRFVYLGDRLRKLPASPGEFLRSDLLSWPGKFRVLAERFIRRGSGADESIYDFGCRRIGKEATEKLLDAFVTGILAGDSKMLSLPACFPRMAELEAEFGSLIRAQGALAKRRRAQPQSAKPMGGPGGKLTVTQGGMRTLVEAMADSLSPNVRYGQSVRSIEPAGDGWSLRTDAGSYAARAVVLACPAYAQARMLRTLCPNLAEEIGAIPYTTAVVAAVGFRREDLPADLRGFGYLTPQGMKRPVLGVLWSSSIFPAQAPEGQYQFRAIMGGWHRRDVLEWEDRKIIAAVCSDLKQTLEVSADPVFSRICRWEKAIPQYHLGHLDRLARIEKLLAPHPGLFLTGNSYRGVSLNDCTADAARTADSVLTLLAGAASPSGKPDS